MAASAANEVAVLDPDTCWDLVANEEVGRLAIAVARHPDIFPVNHVVDDRSIVFRTAEGTKFSALFVDHDVAFEVDGFDPVVGDAWSVVVKGWAAEIPTYEVPDDVAFQLFSWSAAPKTRFVRITPEEISGRRFHVTQRRPPTGGA